MRHSARSTLPRLFAAALGALALAAPSLAQTYRETVIAYGTDGLPSSATTIDPSGPDRTTSFNWDAVGNLVEVTDPSGRRVTASYNNDRRLTAMTTAAGSAGQGHARFRYDATGRLTHADTSPDGSASPASWVTTAVVYTPAGKVASVTDPAGDVQSFTYDAAGQLSTQADPEGRTRRMTYLPDGLIRNVWEGWGTGEQMRSEMHWYNAAGERTQFRPAYGIGGENEVLGGSYNPDYASLWSFDAFGRVSQFRLPGPDAGTARPRELYAYDANGNLTQRTTRANDVIATVYDASGRPTHKTAPVTVGGAATATTVTAYNRAGDPVSVTAPDQHGAGSWQLGYTYDFAGRQLSETQTTPEAITRTVSYQYNASGDRTRITWPDGFFVSYEYDSAGRLSHVRANGTMLLAQYSYDAQGRLTGQYLTNTAGNPVGAVLAGYEIDGDLASLDYVFEGAPNVRFDYGYDRSGYLTAQEVDNTDWRWSPAISTVGYQSASYATNRLDQYTAVSGQAYSYDLNGNLTSDGLRAFTYTAENQLLTATTLTGGTAQYSYGPAARRVRKEVDGTGTDFVHAGAMEIAEYDSVSGQLLRRYIPGAGVDQRVATVECGAGAGATACVPGGSGVVTRHYVADRQGNVMAVANADGTLHQQFFYTPFGVELVGEESGNPFRYTGRRYDPETGLYYYRARYYDADLGRFLQVDPVGYADQWNLYAYVGNNPLNATDPTGMCAVDRDTVDCLDLASFPADQRDQAQQAAVKYGRAVESRGSAEQRASWSNAATIRCDASIPGAGRSQQSEGESDRGQAYDILLGDHESVNETAVTIGHEVEHKTLTGQQLHLRLEATILGVLRAGPSNQSAQTRYENAWAAAEQAAESGAVGLLKAAGAIPRDYQGQPYAQYPQFAPPIFGE